MPGSGMLGDFFIGSTMVGDDVVVNSVDAGGGTVHAQTRVDGSMSMVAGVQAAVVTGTTCAASTLALRFALSGSVAGVTHVTAAATASTLRGGSIHGATVTTASSLVDAIVIKAAQSGTAAGRTTVHGAMFYVVAAMQSSVNTRTTVSANMTKLAFLSGGTAACRTTVTASATIHILHGVRIVTRTLLTGFMNLFGRPSGLVAAKTRVAVVEGGFRRAIGFAGSVGSCSSLVKGRLHDYPTDFQDVHILTESQVTGRLNVTTLIKSANVSPIVDRTVVTGLITNKLLLRTATIALRTVVTAKGRYGFGADIGLRTVVRSRLGIKTGINTFKGQTIHGLTTVTGIAPSNGFRGLCAGKTVPSGLMTHGNAASAAIFCMTQLHTHFNGHFAHDGPLGSVALTLVPHGDMGVPDDISGSTAPAADITVERHRMMVLYGNAGLSVDRSLVAHGTATGGTGIRQVGVPVDLSEKVSRQVTYYV